MTTLDRLLICIATAVLLAAACAGCGEHCAAPSTVGSCDLRYVATHVSAVDRLDTSACETPPETVAAICDLADQLEAPRIDSADRQLYAATTGAIRVLVEQAERRCEAAQ